MPDSDEARSLLHHPNARSHIRSFALRTARFTPAQRQAYEQLRSNYLIDYRNAAVDFANTFGRRAPLAVEIGFGMGETTALVAQMRPDWNFIGIEVYPPGVGSLLKQIETLKLSNLRIIEHDAVEVVRDMISPDSLSAIHIFFPDPWHKARHTKRRLIQPPLVALLSRRLMAGGYLHCATDWQPYAEQMRAVLDAESQLSGNGFVERPTWRPATKFERRGLELGHGVWDLVYRREAATRPN
jgi:tRNA (guanine-N7-)-methyltransferase